MTDQSPISFDSAVDMLNTAPAQDDKPAAAVGGADAPNNVDQGAGSSQPDTTDDSALGDLSLDGGSEPGSDAGNDDVDVDQGVTLPPIEPPSSFTDAEKTAFRESPRGVQEAVARREQDRTAELRRVQNETATEKQRLATELQNLQRFSAQVQELVDTTAADIARDFPEINSPQDLVNLAATRPDRAVEFQARVAAYQEKLAIQQRLNVQQTEAVNARRQEHFNNESKRLREAFPDWAKDTAKGVKELTALQDYAIEHGVPEQLARGLTDAGAYKVLQKAAAYDRAVAARAKATDRTAPVTQKPGTTPGKPSSGGATARFNAGLKQLSTTGDFDDALALMRG